MRAINIITCSVVAVPSFTKKIACLGETEIPPMFLAFNPACSIKKPAEKTGPNDWHYDRCHGEKKNPAGA